MPVRIFARRTETPRTGAGVRILLPRVPAAPISPLSVRLRLLGRPAVAANLGATFIWITGAFTINTFVAPVLTAATGWTGPAVSGLLLAYGAAAFAGNAIGGQTADRWGARRSIVVALSSLTVSMGGLAYAAQHGPAIGQPIAIIAVIAWAAAGWSLTPAQAHRLVALTPTAGPEVLSLNTSAFYLVSPRAPPSVGESCPTSACRNSDWRAPLFSSSL